MVRAIMVVPCLLMLGLASVSAQEVIGHSAERAGSESLLTFQLEDGGELVISLKEGRVFLNGSPIAEVQQRRATQSIQTLIDSAAVLNTGQLLAALQQLRMGEMGLDSLSAAVASLAAAEAMVPGAVAATTGSAGASAIARIKTPRAPNRVTVTTVPDASVSLGGERASFAGAIVAGATNLLAVFLALGFMGLGFLFFAPRQLETVADTVWHSFWRSFLAGLFAQPLILPAFGMLLVGLVLTVVGILVLPFAIVGFVLALFVAAVGGFLAVARTVGEIYLRRRMARGEAVPTWGSYRYIVYGLLGLLSLWLPALFLGSVPVAGTVLTVSAAFLTWVLATAGFGAAIISRAGLRGTFVRQLDLALTDEQYWTADGMPAPLVRRGTGTR
jgi:hypothetical protein